MSFNQFQVSGNLGNIPKIPNYWKSTNISETPPYGAYCFPENFTCTPFGQQGGLHRFPTSIPMTSGSNKPVAYNAMGGPSFRGDVQRNLPNSNVLPQGPAPLVPMQPMVVSPTPVDVYPPFPGSSNPLASSFDASNNPMVYPERPGTHPFMCPVPKPKLHYHLQFFADPAIPHSHYGHSKHVKEHNGAVRGLQKPIWFQEEEKAVAVKNLEEDFHGIRLQDCSLPTPIPNPNRVEVHQKIEMLDGQHDEGEVVQVTDASSTLCTKQFSKKKQKKYCRLCKNNKETIKFFRSHNIRDEKGIVTCPILREHVCPYCKATGDNAHTLKYCPKNKRVPRTSQPSQQERTGAPFLPRHMMRTSYGGYKLLKF